jgi:hypothetical protein
MQHSEMIAVFFFWQNSLQVFACGGKKSYCWTKKTLKRKIKLQKTEKCMHFVIMKRKKIKMEGTT